MAKSRPVRVTDHFSFVSGVVQSRDVIRAVAQADALNAQDAPNSTLMKWVVSEGKRYDLHLDFYAIKMDLRMVPPPEMYAIGPDGRVNVATPTGNHTERIEGSSFYGVFRSVAYLGTRAYAVGMGRQVLRRDRPGEWSHVDRGALRDPSTTSVVGFNEIAGIAEKELYAVGFNGEIFTYNGRNWRSVDSPTNVILNSVTVRDDGTAFACGQAGVILSGRGDRWSQIEQDETDEQLWDVEWFGAELYLAADDGLIRMTADGDFEAVTLPEDSRSSPRSVHARDGILLCVGTKSVAYTTDGRTWTELT